MIQREETKQQAVERLFRDGCDRAEIALRIGISRRDVTRCLSDMRRKAGEAHGFIVSERDIDYAAYNHRKAVTGARRALEAMGQ